MPHPSDRRPPTPAELELLDRLNRNPIAFFADIDFPSDALSLKRLRTVFPDKFDDGKLLDGFCLFFDPDTVADTRDTHIRPQMTRLNEMISSERTLFSYAVHDAIDPFPVPDLGLERNEEYAWNYATAKSVLEASYQEFRLADSPATARFMIDNLEHTARQMAEHARSRKR